MALDDCDFDLERERILSFEQVNVANFNRCLTFAENYLFRVKINHYLSDPQPGIFYIVIFKYCKNIFIKVRDTGK